MANFVNADEVEEVSEVTQPSPTMISAADVDEMPDYASGMSPESPINKSPVDVSDRLKMALGNEKGSISFLKQKFEDAKPDADGNLVVKHNGLWHRVDPRSLDDPDPWDATKSIMSNLKNKMSHVEDQFKESFSDIADILPTATKIGGGIGANALAAAATGGTSLIGSAGIQAGTGMALEGLRTSLGRAVGTYDASDEEQLADIGFEGVLNAAGVFVAPAVKVSGQWMANKIGEIGKGLSKLPTGSLNAVKSLQGVLSGTGQQIDRLIERNPWVSGHLKRVVAATKNEADAVTRLVGEQVQQVKKFASKVQPALSSAYRKAASSVIGSVDDSFKGNVGEVVDDVHKLANDLGLGKFVGQPAAKGAPEGLLQEGSKALKFVLHSDDEMVRIADSLLEAGKNEESQMIRQMVGNKEARQVLEEFFETVGTHRGAKEFSGKAGANALLTFRQAINGRINELETKAFNSGAHAARKLVGRMDDRIDAFMKFKFQPKDAAAVNPYSQLQTGYRSLKGQFQPLLDAQSLAIKSGEKAYEDLLGKLASKGGKQVGVKNAFHDAVDFLSKEGDSSIRGVYDSILDREAAKAFIPKIRPGLMGAGAVVSGSMIKGPVGAALGLAATSPRLNAWAVTKTAGAKQVVNSLVQRTGDTAAGKHLVEMGFRSLEFLKHAKNSGQLKALLDNEQAMQAFTNTLLRGVETKYEVRDQLMSKVNGQ